LILFDWKNRRLSWILRSVQIERALTACAPHDPPQALFFSLEYPMPVDADTNTLTARSGARPYLSQILGLGLFAILALATARAEQIPTAQPMAPVA
jgi:hypothetical protein